MQSINAGFNSLRTMLPKHDGEKLSKVRISVFYYAINLKRQTLNYG